MNTLTTTILLFIFVVSASASLFSGGDVKPNNNPIVDKYHTELEITHLGERLAAYILIGAFGAVALLTITLLYYFFRFCRKCWCCCIKACRVKKTRPHDAFDDDEISGHKKNPFVSWILRISLLVLSLLVIALIVVGFVASTEVHKNITETTKTLDDTVSNMNRTAYNTEYTFTNLISFNVSQETINDLKDFMNSTNNLAESTHTLNTEGPHLDSIRNNSAIGVYVFAFLPLIIGVIGAILGRGRLTFIMSMILPWLLIGFWVLFAFHYTMFIINVDICYAVDQFLVANSTDTSTNTTLPVIDAFNCSLYSDAVAPVILEVNYLRELTLQLINETTNETQRAELKTQLTDLVNINSDLQEWQDCSGITNIMSVAYPDICGKAIEASLFLWRSQVGLVVVLLVTVIVGLVAENKITKSLSKEKRGDYSTLALLN